MTYSIIARDPATGDFGVAAQSHWFNLGPVVAWVRYGVGAVATQASADPSYGWRGLALMTAGEDPSSALRSLSNGDGDAEARQVAMLDASGRVAVRTGNRCIAYAGHVSGDGWSVQGNLLTSPAVIEAMAEAYEASEGALADRMLTSLDAAEAAGGDLRGSQSAVLRIVPGPQEPEDRFRLGIDLRVADHPDPLSELRRLTIMDRAYRDLDSADDAAEAGQGAVAIKHFETAGQLSREPELRFWYAIGLARLDRLDDAVSVLDEVVDGRPEFSEMLDRLAVVDPTAERLRRARAQ
jgi:uncharacterized Ntn-hydrolase superfamily protein